MINSGGVTYASEGQMQSHCVKWFHNTHHAERRMLHANDNNSFNGIEGARKRAMGVIRGVSDLELILDGSVVFIELKLPGETQSDEQIDFMNKVRARGHAYVLIYSFLEFINFITNVCNIGK